VVIHKIFPIKVKAAHRGHKLEEPATIAAGEEEEAL